MQTETHVSSRQVDPSLSCAKFRGSAWLEQERPEWAPALVSRAVAYAEAVPQKPIVMPAREGKNDQTIRSAKRQLGLPVESLFKEDNAQGDGRPLSPRE